MGESEPFYQENRKPVTSNQPLATLSHTRSLQIGLAMVVKNEERRIAGALEETRDLFSDIAIVDTGSTDRTTEILSRRFGITPYRHIPPRSNPTDILTARNISMSLCRAPWVLVLDADERISRADLLKLRALSPAADTDGYFMRWQNFRFGRTFEDYKLALIRNRPGFEFLGAAHQVPQTHLRLTGRRAEWCPDVTLYHFPEERRTTHRYRYLHQLWAGLTKERFNTRYRWFYGYSLLQYGLRGPGIAALQRASHDNIEQYPVEAMNSSMVLAGIEARERHRRGAIKAVEHALQLLADFGRDFEVAVNFRAGTWCRTALCALAERRLHDVRPYTFGF